MSLSQLRRGIFWRMCIWGLYAGSVCGGVYGTVLLPIVGTVIGLFIGGGMGLILGSLNGILLSRMTIQQFHQLITLDEYLRMTTFRCALQSAIGVAIIMALLVYGVWLERIDSRSLLLAPVCVVIPSLVAAIVTVSMIWRVMNWYRENIHRIDSDLNLHHNQV